jgi:hypothetical protein
MSYNGSGTFVINSTGQPVVTGTIISSTAFNALTADLATGLSTALTKDGQTTPTANLPMGTFKLTNLGNGTVATDAINLSQLQNATGTFITASGTNTITGTVSPSLGAYATGQMFAFVVAASNTGAATINISGLGAKSITRLGTTALSAEDLIINSIAIIVYDGTQFQLLNPNTFTNLSVSGNLGVGTATPTNKLSVVGGRTNLTANSETFSLGVQYSTGTGLYYIGATNSATPDLVFSQIGGLERMRLTNAGNLGIGTASPTAKLDVVGNGAFTTSVDGTTLTVAGGGVGGQSGQILQTNTYAGVPTPNKYLRVDGTGQWQVLNSAYSNSIISITDAGAANQGNNSSTWTVVSDVRIKQNIRPITNALGKICALNPCHFEYKTRPDKTKTNFIAQEFEQVFPGHVVESTPAMEFKALFADGEKMKSIDADMIPYLVKAIQELKAEFDAYTLLHS